MSEQNLSTFDNNSNTILIHNQKIEDENNEIFDWKKQLQRLANKESCQNDIKNIAIIPNKKWHNSSIVLISTNILISNGVNIDHKCLCTNDFRHPECPITTDSDLNIGSWREFGCGCDECDECISIEYTNDFLNCDCKCQIPSKIATLKQKELSNIENKCIREDCACTSTWNGLEDEYCCYSCRNGKKCLINKHPKPPPIKCVHCSTCVYNIRKHLSNCEVLNN